MQQLLFSAVFFCAFAFAQENQNYQGDETKVLKDDGVVWNTVCPVNGNAVDPEVAIIEFNEKKYGFCSFEHAEKFKGDPKLYSQNLNEDGTKFMRKQKSR